MRTPTIIAAAAAAILTGAGGAQAEPYITPTDCGTYSGAGCAPVSARVDLAEPIFTNPTAITNPLYPISAIKANVMLGLVEGDSFRSESTLMPGTVTVDWDSKKVAAVTMQYAAYRGGRLEEVALDRYAQADDGSVWYLGEDVFDYRNGTVFTNAGTWLAGTDGPAAMIMPATPRLGDVYRSENILGVVFEEMKVTEVGKSVPGPHGPIAGAIVTDELHLDGAHSTKVLAPARGEFSTGTGGDFEDHVLAIPVDALTTPAPPQLALLRSAVNGVLGAVEARDWEAATAIARRIATTRKALSAANQPLAVIAALRTSTAALTRAVRARSVTRSGRAAFEVGISVGDLELQYRPVVAVDRGRFELWSHRVLLDAMASNRTGVLSDVATLEWIRDRFAHTLSAAERDEVDTRLQALRTAADNGALRAAGDHALRLALRLRSLGVT